MDETEDCSSIKGKFDVKDYILTKVPNGQADKFLCTYSKFEFDNKINRGIVLAATKEPSRCDIDIKDNKNQSSSSFSSLGCMKPMGLRGFKVAFCDLEDCNSANAVLIASSWARVLSLMSF